LSAGDDADVLVAFYQHSYDEHIDSVRKGGIVLYDSGHVQPNPEFEKDYHHVPVPISSRTVEAIGGTAKDKGKNIFTLGLVARMFDLNVPKVERLISERFSGKDESIVKNALSAFHAGYGYSLGNILETFQFIEPAKKSGHQVVMTGNEALGYGLIAAGVRFGAAYPITPWSEIMELLRRELPKYGGTFVPPAWLWAQAGLGAWR
jgi:2-oxoglutarate ferredoxin oxidoreductase subunit alpha